MTEATGKEASTLHRLLCIGKLDDEGIYTRHDDYQGEPIDADVVVIDELSMVDMFIMNYLLKCIYQGTKLVLVGDIDQLPSVGPGSVLKDLIESETIKTVHLCCIAGMRKMRMQRRRRLIRMFTITWQARTARWLLI